MGPFDVRRERENHSCFSFATPLHSTRNRKPLSSSCCVVVTNRKGSPCAHESWRAKATPINGGVKVAKSQSVSAFCEDRQDIILTSSWSGRPPQSRRWSFLTFWSRLSAAMSSPQQPECLNSFTRAAETFLVRRIDLRSVKRSRKTHCTMLLSRPVEGWMEALPPSLPCPFHHREECEPRTSAAMPPYHSSLWQSARPLPAARPSCGESGPPRQARAGVQRTSERGCVRPRYGMHISSSFLPSFVRRGKRGRARRERRFRFSNICLLDSMGDTRICGAVLAARARVAV